SRAWSSAWTTRRSPAFSTSRPSPPPGLPSAVPSCALLRRWVLNDTPEDAWLIALGSAVSDGAAVDWRELERGATTDYARRVLHEMRGIAQIVDAHRSDALKDPDESPAPVPPPARQWRHIV